MWGFRIEVIANRNWRRLQVHTLSKDLADSSVINVGADFRKVGQFQSQIHILGSSPTATHMKCFDVI